MITKLIPAALTLSALTAAVAAQGLPAAPASQGYLKLGDIKGEAFGPSLMVLGITVLPFGPLPIPGGNHLVVSPDVVTIWDPDLQLPADLPADFRFYAQRLSLDALQGGGQPSSDSEDAHNDWIIIESFGRRSGRPTQGIGIRVGNPADT